MLQYPTQGLGGQLPASIIRLQPLTAGGAALENKAFPSAGPRFVRRSLQQGGCLAGGVWALP